MNNSTEYSFDNLSRIGVRETAILFDDNVSTENPTLTQELKPTLIALKMFGFLPFGSAPTENPRRAFKFQKQNVLLWTYRVYCIALIGMCAYLLKDMINLVQVYRNNLQFHFLHAMVIVPVVTSSKVWSIN